MCYNHRMSKDTKEKIIQSFIALLEERPLSQIGIKEITTACGINRNTFYYYYKNIPDLIESVVKSTADDLIAAHPPRYDSLEDCLAAAISQATTHRQIIYNIYNSTNRAVFERYLWKVCDYVIDAYLDSFPPLGPTPAPEEAKIIHDTLKYTFFGFIIDWINHGMPDNVTEKIHILSDFLQKRIILRENF